MSNEVVISVKDLKKKFKVYMDKGSNIKEKVLFWKRNRYENRWVLNGVSFDVKKGEAIGLIGKNGCGKSTTLKMLTRILYPTSGTIKVTGRVSSLIELGAGFHPDLSGRENIYTNASIFGLSKNQIDERIESIISFSELEEFIDNPVRTYSSGMYMRLAFSVAINVDADVLLIDEILAVGDVSFQKKCFERLMEIKRLGTTIVIVSHSLDQIEKICDRSLWIENGLLKMDDKPEIVHEKYNAQMEKERLEKIKGNYAGTAAEAGDDDRMGMFLGRKVLRFGIGEVQYTDVVLKNKNDEVTNVFTKEDDMHINLHYKNTAKDKAVVFCIRIYAEDGTLCFGTNTDMDLERRINISSDGSIEFVLKNEPMQPGHYIIDIDIGDEKGMQDVINNAVDFYVEGNSVFQGIMQLQHEWNE